jgi:antitoxin VapB
MAERAKIFMNGGSQAVRLPKSCRFPEGVTEVSVRCEDGKVILERTDEWSPEFLALLGSWKEDIPLPPRTPVTKLRDPFSIPMPKTRKRRK